MPFIWVRLGDADTYNRFDDLAEAAEYMALFGVKHVWRCQRFGVEAQGLIGQNYISLFFGDGDAQPSRELSGKDVHFLNERLLKDTRV
jgi:hypothetical protein